MNRIKEFYNKNKKVVILATIILALLIAVIIYFASQQANVHTNKKAETQTEEKVAASKKDSKQEDHKQETSKEDSKQEVKKEEQKEDSKENKDKNIIDKTSPTTSTNQHNSGNNSSNQSSSSKPTSHEHNWVTKTWTEERPIKQYVTSEKKEYTLYRFYWYNTHTWEETRDSNRFYEWDESEYGGLYIALHPYDKPEDNPLFIGYDSNGHEMYRNDHAIISNLFEWVPCEPYEKTEIQTVTITTITCSICGATK